MRLILETWRYVHLTLWGNMGQDAHPKNPGSYLNNQWMKLFEINSWPNTPWILALQTFSLWNIWYRRNKATFGRKWPHMWAKRPSSGAKRPPPVHVYCAATGINLRWIIIYDILNSIETNTCPILDNTACVLIKFNHTAQRCLCDKHHFIQISDHFR